MNHELDTKSRAQDPVAPEALDPALQQALNDFKASVHSWSEAEFSRPRTSRQTVAGRTWRLVAGWSLAGLLLAGTVSGGLYERHQSQLRAEAAARAAAQERALAAQQAREAELKEEEILASVDTAVSREVPKALEPLADLSDEMDSQQQKQ